MSEKQSKIQILQQIDPDNLLDRQQATAIQLSYNEPSEAPQQQESNEYPSMRSQSNSWKKNRFSKDSRDDLDDMVVGVKRSSYALQDSINSDSGSLSLSCLNSSIKEEETTKSKLQSKLKNLKKEEDELEEQPPTEKEMKMFNQSIFTQRTGMQQSILKKKASQSPQNEDFDPVNYGKSFYLTEKEPKTKAEAKTKQPKQQDKGLSVKLISKDYFLQLKESNVEVDRESLQNLYNQLFKKEIFVPLFNYERYEEWTKNKEENKYTLENQTHLNFKIYLERYVAYLNETCPEVLEDVVKNVQLIQQGRPEKRTQTQAGFSLFNFDFNTLLQNFKSLIHSSKTIVLRKTLLCKIRSLNAILKERERWSMTAEQAQLVKMLLNKTWEDLAEVQLLVSFDQTEELCVKKIESSPQLKFKEIWLKYREANRKQKNSFMGKLEIVTL